MVINLMELELSYIEHLDRTELIQAIQAHADQLPGDLLEQLDEQPTDHLQLHLLASRLIRVLRHLRGRG
jgi:hypothetical protein